MSQVKINYAEMYGIDVDELFDESPGSLRQLQVMKDHYERVERFNWLKKLSE